jgi:hypothetical protein
MFCTGQQIRELRRVERVDGTLIAHTFLVFTPNPGGHSLEIIIQPAYCPKNIPIKFGSRIALAVFEKIVTQKRDKE